MSNKKKYTPELVIAGSVCLFFYRGLAGLVHPIRRKGLRVGRNDDCKCGSGKKFKNCCRKE